MLSTTRRVYAKASKFIEWHLIRKYENVRLMFFHILVTSFWWNVNFSPMLQTNSVLFALCSTPTWVLGLLCPYNFRLLFPWWGSRVWNRNVDTRCGEETFYHALPCPQSWFNKQFQTYFMLSLSGIILLHHFSYFIVRSASFSKKMSIFCFSKNSNYCKRFWEDKL